MRAGPCLDGPVISQRPHVQISQCAQSFNVGILNTNSITISFTQKVAKICVIAFYFLALGSLTCLAFRLSTSCSCEFLQNCSVYGHRERSGSSGDLGCEASIHPFPPHAHLFDVTPDCFQLILQSHYVLACETVFPFWTRDCFVGKGPRMRFTENTPLSPVRRRRRKGHPFLCLPRRAPRRCTYSR